MYPNIKLYVTIQAFENFKISSFRIQYIKQKIRNVKNIYIDKLYLIKLYLNNEKQLRIAHPHDICTAIKFYSSSNFCVKKFFLKITLIFLHKNVNTTIKQSMQKYS